CREGICGSCAMNIDGTNTLACTKGCDAVDGAIRVYPLPHMPVVKDLVPDLTVPYAQLSSIPPWLQTVSPEPAKEWRQSHEDRARATGGLAPAIWARPLCRRHIAALPTAVTQRPASVSTTSRTPSASIAATPS